MVRLQSTIYIGTIRMRGAYRGTKTGYVGAGWAREHHALWHDDVKVGKIAAQRPQQAGPGEPVQVQENRMKAAFKPSLTVAIAVLALGAAQAKLPVPAAATEESNPAQALAAANAGWGNKVAAYRLCKSQDTAAADYFKTANAAGKQVEPPRAAPACADAGPFVAVPAAPAAADPAKKS